MGTSPISGRKTVSVKMIRRQGQLHLEVVARDCVAGVGASFDDAKAGLFIEPP